MAQDLRAKFASEVAELARCCGPQAGEGGPVSFVCLYLGVKPDKWQDDVLRQYGRGEKRISIRSAHGVGKTSLLSWIALYNLYCRYPQTTLVTAPSGPQLDDVLWKELGKWHQKLNPLLQQVIEIKAESAVHRANPSESFITARTAKPENAESMQGRHREDGYVTIIVDEASGVEEPIFEALAGSMSGSNVTTILASNPIRTTGLFYETHNSLATEWRTHHVGKKDSARVTDDYEQMIARQYGKDSPAYRIRVLGEFPLGGHNSVIPPDLVESAMTRDVAPLPTEPVVWGLDVARFGDDRTCLAKRQGRVLLEKVMGWNGLDTMQTVGRVKAEWETTQPSARPVEILVDVIGVGAGVCDRLQQMNLPAIGINVSETPSIGETFHRLRDELWFAGKQWFARRDVAIPRDEDLLKELTAPGYGFAPTTQKIVVHSKDRVKKDHPRMGSPDKADAFLLTFAGTAATSLGMNSTLARWNEPLERELLGCEA